MLLYSFKNNRRTTVQILGGVYFWRSSRAYYYSYETRCNHLSKVTTAGVLNRRVRLVQVRITSRNDSYQGSVCPRGRGFHTSMAKARQGRAWQRSCFDGRVYGYHCACWLSWNSCSEPGPRKGSWIDSAREPPKQHEAETSRGKLLYQLIEESRNCRGS